MRTLNLRLAGILIAITIVFGAGVYFLHGYQQKRNAVFFLEQADVAKQQYDKAHEEKKTEEEEKALEQQLKYLQWYISFRPDDLKAIEQLALILADRVNNPRTYMQAYSLLDKVVRDDSSRNKARRKLIQLAILGERFSDAHYHLSNLLNETADDPELLDLLGQCQEGMGENAAAAESYNKAIESSPKLLDTYWRLASLLRVRLERPAEADKSMQKLVENNPDSTKAYVYRGNYLRSIGSTEEAMKTSEQALEISADDQDALLLAAQCAMASGDLVKARKYAEHCLENHRDIGIIYTVLAEIFLRGEDREKAIDILDQGLKETKNAAPILWFKANLLIDNENVDQAKETIKKIRATEYPKPLVDYLDARVVFLQKNWAEASRQLEKVRPSMSAYPQFVKQVDLWLGYCYGKLNNSDQEIRAYQRALAIDPFFATARQYLTDALVKSGRFEEAIQEYIKLAKMGALPPSGLIALANAMIRQTLQKDVNERQWGPVEQALANAEQRNPGVLQIDLLRAEILHAQDKNAEAEKILLKAVEKYPRQIDCWNALLTMVAVQKKWEQAETILGNFEKYFGDTVDVRSIKAEYFIQRYGPKAGENLMRLTENTANFSDAELVRLWGGLLNAARRINDKEVAQHMLDLLAQKDVKNLDIQYLRMEQAANAGDIPTLEITLADVEKIEGQGPLWLVGQARLLILKAKDSDPDKLDEALGCLMKAHELRPSWSRVYLLIGSIYDTQKKYVRALTNLREAINLGERNPAIVHRVVQLLFQQQNYKDADKLLRQLDHEQVPFTIELTRMWVQLLLRQDEFDLAATKAREAVSSKTDEYHD
ncbi:MAG TPA: tetratricopeptide repeat protein, partial [Thermoguttaceae bacterium]